MRRRAHERDDGDDSPELSEQMSVGLLNVTDEHEHGHAATMRSSKSNYDAVSTRSSQAGDIDTRASGGQSAFTASPSASVASLSSSKRLWKQHPHNTGGAGQWHIVEECASPAARRLPLRTGQQHVVYTEDTVGAISWGIAPCSLLPCCLGERKKGVKVLHVGFQFGRHVELFEHDPPPGQRGHYFSFLFPLPVRYVTSATSGTATRVPIVGNSRSRDAKQANVEDAGGAEDELPSTSTDRREFLERLAAHPRGCLEMTPDGRALTTGEFDPESVSPTQIFRVAPVTEFSGTFTGVRWRAPDEPPELAHCRYVIAPLTDLTLRLEWQLNGGVIARPPQDNAAQQVFLIRPRAPHLITDFVVEGVPFCARVKSSFSRAEDDYRQCLIMQHDNTREGSPLIKDAAGQPAPRFPTIEAPVRHDFISTQLGRTASIFVGLLGIVNATTTIVITVGIGYDGEDVAAMSVRYTLYTLVVLTYLTLWIQHNQYYSARMFEFLIRRGFLLDLPPDVASPQYLFFGGWNWYWFAIVVFLALGGVYLVYMKEAPLGTSWVFFSNSFLYFVGQVYKIRAPFDQQLMPLSIFIKSFDNGLISEIAVRRAAEYLRGLRPVQGCVPLANPPAYVYLGQLPTSVRCCWGCGKFSGRATVIIILSLIVGFAMLAAVVLKATLTKVDAFAAVNACVADCVAIGSANGTRIADDALCTSCVCLCARTLKLVSTGFETTCKALLDVAQCSAAASCPSSCHR